jgi:hypothetical protein
MKKKTARSVHTVSSRNASMLATDEMRSFLIHFILYLLINFGLFIYLFSNGGNLNFFYWVVAGWGIGLVAHALAVFGVMKFLAKEW